MRDRKPLVVLLAMDITMLYASFLAVLLGLDAILSLLGRVAALLIALLILLVAGYVTGSLAQRYARGALLGVGAVLVAALAALLLVYLSVPLYDVDALMLSLLLLAPVMVTACTRIMLDRSKVLEQKRS